jgi:hypothetical protein
LFSNNLSFFEHWSSDRFHSGPAPITLLLWGLFLVFLFITISFALVPSWEEFDDDDFHLLKVAIIWITTCLSFGTLSLGFELGVFAIILRLEHLASHIGEKRPSDSIIKINRSFLQAYLAMTALLNSAVILLFFLPLMS